MKEKSEGAGKDGTGKSVPSLSDGSSPSATATGGGSGGGAAEGSVSTTVPHHESNNNNNNNNNNENIEKNSKKVNTATEHRATAASAPPSVQAAQSAQSAKSADSNGYSENSANRIGPSMYLKATSERDDRQNSSGWKMFASLTSPFGKK